MFSLIKKLDKDRFIRDSLVLTVSFFIFNVANFFYHFYAARKLGPEDYAVVASLFSVLYLFSVLANVLQTSITKFTSNFYAKKDFGKIKYLRNKAMFKMLKYSCLLFVSYVLISPLISSFLHIGIIPILITGIMLLFMLVLPVNRGILQGMQKFYHLGSNLVLEGILKLGLTIALIYFGFRINGALGAVIIASVIALAFSFIKIQTKPKKFNSKEIYSYSYPVLIAMLSITAMYSVDVFLAKHLFSENQAGLYSAISLLGKIVFFGATAISLVMFSKVSELHAQNKEHRSIRDKALMLTGLMGLLITAIYFFFPKLILVLVFGKEYLGGSGILGFFGIFMTFLALSYMLSLYKLSINKKKFVYLLLLFNLIQIIGLYIIGNNLIKWVYFLDIISILLFLSLTILSKSK